MYSWHINAMLHNDYFNWKMNMSIKDSIAQKLPRFLF